MRYILLIHGDESGWDALSDAERAARYERYGSLQTEMEKRGHYVGGDEIASANEGKVLRVREGRPVVTDGPFAETKEQFGGYFVVDCDDLDQAIEVAQRVPVATKGSVEIRPFVP